MSDRDLDGDMDLDGALRQEGEVWRAQRTACPDPDLLLARGSEALEPEVRERLDQHLASCANCARFVRDLEAVDAESSDASAESRVLARIAPRRTSRSAPWFGLAAAIVAAVGLAAFWWSRPAPSSAPPVPQAAEAVPTAIPPTHIEPPPAVALWMVEPAAVRVPLSALGTSRSGESGGEERAAALIQALSPYQKGDFAAAADRLEALVRQDPAQADAHLYLGVSYLMIDRPTSALGPLERARTLAPANRRAEIDWYLATAEQRSGQVEASRARLRGLCAGGTRFRAGACAAENALE